MNEEEIQQEEKELSLQVFQYSDYDFVIGLVDFDQLNSSDFAFTIHHVLALTYDDEIDNYRLFRDLIVDSSRVYNLSKHKVIAMFSPSPELQEEYFELIQTLHELDSFEENDEEDGQNFKEYLQIGNIQ